MKFTDINECSKLIEAFGNIEINILNTKYQIACEASMNDISYEVINDLKEDLSNLAEAVSMYPMEQMNVNRVMSESFVKFNKAKRMNSDTTVFESILDDMLLEFINKRKSIIYDGDVELEFFVNNLQNIYDHYISESINIEVGNDITFTGLMEGIGNILANIKNSFGSKHDKLVARDQKWLKDNKKKLLALDYNNIELEVPSDYKVTFASLINHHDIFDKNFKGDNPSDEKISRFKDKSGNLKNGLDNYYRTGSSRREIGLRKVSGNEAKNVVKAMIEYCNDFLSGKKYIDEKLDSITKDIEDEEPVKESMQILSESTDVFSSNTSDSLKELDNLYNEIIEKGYKSPMILNRQFGLMRIAIKDSVKSAKTKNELNAVNKEVRKSVSKMIELSKKNPVIGEYLGRDDKHKKWMKYDYVELIREKEQEIQEGKETSLSESTLNNNGLIFISEEKFNDGKVLYPRIPKNFLVDNGYEDNKTPRICFSTSIDKALTALSSNLKGKELYVYEPIDIDNKYIIKPTVDQVPDSSITDEVWYTKTAKIKCVKKIRVIEAGDEEYHYRYGNNSATLYNWIWEEIYSISESTIYESNQILEEGTITNAVKTAWSKLEEIDSKLYVMLFSGAASQLIKPLVGAAKTAARTSVKLACLGPDITFIRHQNEHSIKTLKAVAKKKPGNRILEDYIQWLENDFVDMINEKGETIKKFKGKFKKDGKKMLSESVIYEADDNASKSNEDDDDLGLEDDPIDDIDTEDNTKEPKEEKNMGDMKKDTDDAVNENNLARDRQTGITVLMTIAEERYFDYMDILTSLLK